MSRCGEMEEEKKKNSDTLSHPRTSSYPWSECDGSNSCHNSHHHGQCNGCRRERAKNTTSKGKFRTHRRTTFGTTIQRRTVAYTSKGRTGKRSVGILLQLSHIFGGLSYPKRYPGGPSPTCTTSRAETDGKRMCWGPPAGSEWNVWRSCSFQTPGTCRSVLRSVRWRFQHFWC